MNVLVINAGSSSLKYQLLNVETKKILSKGICERVGSPESFIKHGIDENEIEINTLLPTHDDAIKLVLEQLISGEHPAITTLDEIDAVGHRIVQGGKYFDKSVLIDDDVIAKIDELAELAPLHNKAALMGIYACQHHMPGVPMVAVFDSAYFQTLPERAYVYPIPFELSEKYSIRKYGAHGTSHRFVAQEAAEFLQTPLEDLKLITCHLGSGCSISAIKNGVAIDTTMGLTPLDGLMMGTRCGAIDPSIITYLMEHEGYTPQQMSHIMNKESGLLGVSGVSNDARSLNDARKAGNERAALAFDMFAYSIKRYIGQFVFALGGVDAIVLTAGIGENSVPLRRMIFEGLEPLGIILDHDLNQLHGFTRQISSEDSTVKIIVVPTNEEYMIAHDTFDIVNNL